MQPFRITAFALALSLVACSGGENEPPTPNTPDTDAPLTGSITISTSPKPELESLPDVTYTPGTDESDDRPVDGAVDGAVDAPLTDTVDESAASTAGSSDTGGGTGGATGSGSGDTGITDAGSGDAGTTDADASTSSPSGEDGASVSRPETLPIAPDHRPQPEFQAGSLTAADYDDQLNPHLYQRYASNYLQTYGGKLDVPYLDLSNRIALYVTDEQGRPYGGVNISITDANNEIVNLRTPASGITYLYRDIDKLPAQFVLRAEGLWGTAVDQTINLADLGSGRIDIVVPENAAPADATRPSPVLDIMFVIDTTGSMGDELNYLQTELTSIIGALPTQSGTINLGLTFYRDIGDEYVVRAHGFNDDLQSVQQTLNQETYDGGGDYPEAMDQALHQAVDANWQNDSNKILFLIADAPPHGNKMRATWNAAEQARKKNIHIVPVAASGVAEDAEYLMRSMAAFTNSRYLFLTDDSGFGNAHAEPDVDCYVVTQLNNLMIRVLNSLISGKRQEPTDNEIIRRVGNYNEGVCAQTQTQ